MLKDWMEVFVFNYVLRGGFTVFESLWFTFKLLFVNFYTENRSKEIY